MLAWQVLASLLYFLLILQNCGRARSSRQAKEQPQPTAEQRRDGLAKFEFSAAKDTTATTILNFAHIYETLCAQLGSSRRGKRQQEQVVLITTRRPLRIAQQLQQDLQELLQHTTTVKPFNLAEQLRLQQLEQLQQTQRLNVSYEPLKQLEPQLLQLEQQTSSPKPFELIKQLDKELQQQQAASFEEPDQSKAADEPEESTRAKGSNKRKRKRIQRRRKRIRKRRKRKRKRGKKKRKKKKQKGDKKKKKRKRRKQTTKPQSLGQPAHLIFANPTKQPHHYAAHAATPQQQLLLQLQTTKRPATPTSPAPFSKIKYLLRHNAYFKKKKKEWFHHMGHVLYPFVKFVAFFTVLNPFTLGVFLFTLISPAVFGFIGFVALSVLVKPFLHLIFGVKHSVAAIEYKRRLANKRAEQLKLNLRPVTIHKHYYQQRPLGHATPPRHLRPVANWRRQEAPAAAPNPNSHRALRPEQIRAELADI
ncbi:CG13724 [Drosophila busckii]|uniref:CG13724 n=1 Tax=Drosophila busckii TaxID=30019 RepID=A0A0M4EML3_DROBS|nr:uncharacterized protein LOC108599132 [Drosophila busckii]ALC44960.1 CG13724 [Drosophila busckii]